MDIGASSAQRAEEYPEENEQQRYLDGQANGSEDIENMDLQIGRKVMRITGHVPERYVISVIIDVCAEPILGKGIVLPISGSEFVCKNVDIISKTRANRTCVSDSGCLHTSKAGLQHWESQQVE